MRINDYSLKYVCVVCYLKIRFDCLTFSAMSNLNQANFITPNQSPVINAFWIRFRVVRYRFVKYRLVRYTFRFVKLRDKYTDIPSKYFVCLHKIFKRSSRHVFKTSSRHVFKTLSRHVFKTSSRHVFKTSSRRLQRNNLSSSKTFCKRF